MTRPHGTSCDSSCTASAVDSPLERVRPPAVPCPWCGAAPGVACTVRGARKSLTVVGRFHPSRLEGAA